MKTTSYFSLIVLLAAFSACSKKDNYDPPQSKLTGALMYKGDSIYLEYNRVPYQLYQYGYGKLGPIEQTFTQSGTINSLLFNGDYKFIVPNGQGPFLWPKTGAGSPDSVNITMNGNQNLNIEVTPYYMIRNAQITGSGGSVSANFKAEKIITDANAKDIDNVVLYINKTGFVSGANNIAQAAVAGADITDLNNINLSVAIPTLTQKYVFARVGLKIAGIEDMIFSPLVQVSF
ncbi:MAG TPA: DUF3823 domain-containing protein [Parafilimonas sp.]|nr:DUF3823 domain-containing protein [Parafilimonas sp.]